MNNGSWWRMHWSKVNVFWEIQDEWCSLVLLYFHWSCVKAFIFDCLFFSFLQAAGRHQCTYLINQLKEEFLKHGGDPRWLEGLENIPQKLRDIYEINKILAHRPWLLKQTHIEVMIFLISWQGYFLSIYLFICSDSSNHILTLISWSLLSPPYLI